MDYIDIINAIKAEKKVQIQIKPVTEGDKPKVDIPLPEELPKDDKDIITLSYRVIEPEEVNVTIRQKFLSLSQKSKEEVQIILPSFFQKEASKVGRELPWEVKDRERVFYGLLADSKSLNGIINELELDYKDENGIKHNLLFNSKDGNILELEYASGDREGEMITLENLFGNRDGSGIGVDTSIGDKDEVRISTDLRLDDKDGREISGVLTLDDKNGSEISGLLNIDSKSEVSAGSDISVGSRSGANIGTDMFSGDKDRSSLSTSTLTGSKDGAAITITENQESSSSSRAITISSIADSKNSVFLRSGLRSDMTGRGNTQFSIDTGYSAGDTSLTSDRDLTQLTWSNLFEPRNKTILDATTRLPVIDFSQGFGQGMLHLFDSDLFTQSGRYQEQVLYARMAKHGYYPAGTMDEISEAIGGGIDNIISILNNSDGQSWSSSLNSTINVLGIADSAMDILWADGARKNMANPYNQMRYDLRINDQALEGMRGRGKYENTIELDEQEIDEKKESKELLKDIDQTPDRGKVENTIGLDEQEIDEKKESKELLKDIEGIGPEDMMGRGKGENTIELEKHEIVEEREDVFSYSKFENKSQDDDTIRNLPAVGSIYVTPPISNWNGGAWGSDSILVIPLQNNIETQTLSRTASYNRIQFFGRIGEVKQFANTGDLQDIEITTKYIVETDDGSTPNNLSAKKYTMRNLQDIEMMYRSLIFPAKSTYSEKNSQESSLNNNPNFYYYSRPPIINVILGDYSNSAALLDQKKKGVFKNMFTNIDDNGDLYYRNFVVTNVTINKDTELYNYYVKATSAGQDGDKDQYDYFDTMGFTVTLSLLEIDENYLNSMPSFNSFVNFGGGSDNSGYWDTWTTRR